MILYVRGDTGAPYLIFDTSPFDYDPVSIHLSYNPSTPNTLTGTLTVSNGQVYTQSNTNINIHSGKYIAGFSTIEDADTVNVPLNRTVKISRDTRYIYAVFRNTSNTVTVSLYNSSAESNVVNKTSKLTDAGSLSGTFRGEVSVTNPSITFYFRGVPTFNYVYIQKFSRYYYVTALTNISNNLWRADLKCDVLMSFKNQILNLYCVIARQENVYNDNLIDSELLQENGETVTYVPIPNSIINVQGNAASTATAHNYLLTVVGGGQ